LVDIFLRALGFSEELAGTFMSLTLLGDVFLGTLITFLADSVGRRRILVAGSVLMVSSGVIFALCSGFWVLLLAAVIGVISITGGDFGPFRSIEESILSQLTTPSTRSDVLSWYVTIPLFGSAAGTEVSGRIVEWLQARDGWTLLDAYHSLFWLYAVMGIVNGLLMLMLTESCELQSQEKDYDRLAQDESEAESPTEPQTPDTIQSPRPSPTGWKKAMTLFSSRLTAISTPTLMVMAKLWFLLATDSLADGMVPYTVVNHYMDDKFKPAKSTLGDVTSASYLLGAISAVFAGPLAKKIGLINTMVFTHVPSSAAVLLFPFPPVFWATVLLLLVRAGLNNMDQAPRTAFIAAVVKSDERTAVMGITAMVRTVASMFGPTIYGSLAGSGHFTIVYVLAGSFRLAYDFGLYALFVNMRLYQHEDRSNEDISVSRATRQEHDEEANLELQDMSDMGEDSLHREGKRNSADPTSLV
jgi:MFS family permease